MGGPVSAFGGPYIVGERGPELFTPGASGSITPNNALGSGGNTINVTVTSANPNDVVLAIQKWVRNNGSVPLATTAGVRY
jgi:phage-related minor tail protein